LPLDRRTFLAGAVAVASLRPSFASASSERIVVMAAASLTNALREIVSGYHEAGPISASFGASASLARQIEQGARAHIFASADPEWMDYLDARGLIDRDSRRDVLSNRLVLIAAARSDVSLDASGLQSLVQALGSRGRLALADPDYVPAGRYARAALTSLGVWPAVSERLARAENVRAAMALVARGEAPLGIVYASDVFAEKRVRQLALFPEASHPRILYPFARLAGVSDKSVDAAFRYITSAQAAAVYRRNGFIVLPPRARQSLAAAKLMQAASVASECACATTHTSHSRVPALLAASQARPSLRPVRHFQ
jgi:molybdate transport system substrate-binding protein